MFLDRDNTKYPAYTLLEMLLVISIFIVLGGFTFAAFDGLQNTIKTNEYMLNIEQDIRSIQRSAMLLERDTDENWIYGLGIDFSEVTEDGVYKMFKWCSPFDDYGDITTKSGLPAYDPSVDVGASITSGLMSGQPNATLPLVGENFTESSCTSGVGSDLRTLPGFDRSITLPKSDITLNPGMSPERSVRYILFESVSGRAYFYNEDGSIINYDSEGVIWDFEDITDFEMEITPLNGGSTRTIAVKHLSGKIDTGMY